MEGCTATTGTNQLESVSDKAERDVVTVIIRASGIQDLIPGLLTNKTMHIVRPQPIASVVEKVNRQLRQGESVVSAWTIVAVVLAIASVLGTLLFPLGAWRKPTPSNHLVWQWRDVV